MADLIQTYKPANQQATGLSPWDDDVPEEIEEPRTVGTLHDYAPKKDTIEPRQAAFNVPENIEQNALPKVVSADEIVRSAQPIPEGVAALITPGEVSLSNNIAADLQGESMPAATLVSEKTNIAEVVPKEVPAVEPNIQNNGTFPSENNAFKPDVEPNDSATTNRAPGVTDITRRESSPVVQGSESKPILASSSEVISGEKIAEASVVGVKSEPSFLSSIFKKNEPKVVNETKKSAISSEIDQNTTKQVPAGTQKIGSLVFAVISGVFVLVAALVLLTEFGFISFGFENFYGTLGIQNLWGGLSPSTEKAIGRSFVEMQNHSNFKLTGSLALTLNKSVKSPITTPLISRSNESFSSLGLPIKAILATADTTLDDLDLSDPSVESSDYMSTDTDTSDDSTNDDVANQDVDQSSEQPYETDTTTSKVISTTFNGFAGKGGSQLDFTINRAIGSDSLTLKNAKNEVWVKSDQIKFDDAATSDKWVKFDLSKPVDKSVSENFFDISAMDGASVKGSRIGNDKIGKTRCFNYEIKNAEIGNTLESLGITSDMIQTVSGNIWIGTKDKLVHKIDLDIVTATKLSVSMIKLDATLRDYDSDVSFSAPDPSEIVSQVNTNSGQSSTDSSVAVDSDVSDTSEVDTPVEAPVESPVVAVNANDQIRKNDLETIKVALNKYKLKYGKYPKSSTSIKLNTKSNILKSALVPTYLTALPNDPKDTADGWYYGYSSDATTFALNARLEDTTDATGQLVGSVYLYFLRSE